MSSEPRQHPRVLITAGPTHEPIDRVRYLGNRSSGRIGVALANQSMHRRWPTTLLLGPATADPAPFPQECTRRFRTAAELESQLQRAWPQHDVLIMAAAVADYRPAHQAPFAKMRRENKAISLLLEPTPDLLAALADSTRDDQLVIGFALEPPEALEVSAKDKLRRKRLDAIVANPIETLEANTIDAVLFLRDGSKRTPGGAKSKDAFATWLLDEVASMRASRPSALHRVRPNVNPATQE